MTGRWRKDPKAKKVDQFATAIRDYGISFGNTPLSLASKVLFLNDPVNILPIDAQVRKSVRLTTNSYEEYLPLVEKHRKDYAYKQCLDFIAPYAHKIEQNFKAKIDSIREVRQNRMLDIYLWSVNGTEEANEAS